jgi:hypothetical protein
MIIKYTSSPASEAMRGDPCAAGLWIAEVIINWIVTYR